MTESKAMEFFEIIHRISSPGFASSGVVNALSNAWYRVAPGEFPRHFRAVRPYTMSSAARLRTLHEATKHVVSANIAGDVVECGTAKGGSAALLALALDASGSDRLLWIFDTFEGMPEPSANDPDLHLAEKYVGTCRGTIEEVTTLFRELDVLQRTRMVKGMFQDTLSAAPIERIALLHIDGDWYDSVKACLQHFYDRVSPGGIVQIDDYGYWEGARKAVDDFFTQRGVALPALRHIDYAGRQFVKS